MKKVISMLLVLILLCATVPALAAGKLSTTQENFWVISSYWTYAYAYAKVENVGNKPINVNAGVLEVYDENGDVITSSDYLSTYAKCLQPGEYTYVSISKEIELAEDVGKPDDYMLTITGKTDDSSSTLRLPAESRLSLGESNGYWKEDYMYATVTNNTDDIVYNISTVFALLDEEGKILYVANDSLYNSHGLTPGSSIVVKAEISSSFMDYFSAKNIKPTTVDVIAYVDK